MEIPTEPQAGERHLWMRRKVITPDALQSLIAEAVRASNPQCRGLLEVFVEPVVPKSRGDANWAVRGVKYGRAERTQCDAAISPVVEQLQQEFVVVRQRTP
jgi:hypothetical protein